MKRLLPFLLLLMATTAFAGNQIKDHDPPGDDPFHASGRHIAAPEDLRNGVDLRWTCDCDNAGDKPIKDLDPPFQNINLWQ